MIARIWRGTTLAERAEAYLGYLKGTGIRDYLATPGNRGVLVLRRYRDGLAEYLLISFWESTDAVRGFAGAEVDRAVYYPEDRDYLLALEPNVDHYEVAAESRSGGSSDQAPRPGPA